MGIFDIFKKKADQSKKGNLSLEMLLQKAAITPAYREEFYKRLLTDNLVVITQDGGLPGGSTTLEKDTEVNIVSYPDGKIPVFTSTQRIFDKGVVKEQVTFLEMKGENHFGLAVGATFLLNPYSDYGKEILPSEIEHMLNGIPLTHSKKQIKIEKETPVQIGQPVNYPTEIIIALRQLFSDKQNIKAAYMGWIYNPASTDPPHYIFAIDGEGDIENITDEAGYVAKNFLTPEDIIDFIRIDNSVGLSDYFLKQTKPFYEIQ